MQMCKVSVDRLPLSLNTLLAMHWRKREDDKRSWNLHVTSAWRRVGSIVFINPIHVTYLLTFDSKRIRDLDNYIGGTKYITDALKRTFITRDDADWLRGVSVKFSIGVKPGTEILIEEAPNVKDQVL